MRLFDVCDVSPDAPVAQFHRRGVGCLQIGTFDGQRLAMLQGPVDANAADLDEALILLGWRRESPWLVTEDGGAICVSLIEHAPADPDLAIGAQESARTVARW